MLLIFYQIYRLRKIKKVMMMVFDCNDSMEIHYSLNRPNCRYAVFKKEENFSSKQTQESNSGTVCCAFPILL